MESGLIADDRRFSMSFGGIDGCMMYVTTNKALYAGRLEERK
jgi:hypothetical protein